MNTIKQAIQELKYWHFGNATNFTALLFALISKADPQNKEKLGIAFPMEVLAFDMWQQSPDEEEFFRVHLDEK